MKFFSYQNLLAVVGSAAFLIALHSGCDLGGPSQLDFLARSGAPFQTDFSQSDPTAEAPAIVEELPDSCPDCGSCLTCPRCDAPAATPPPVIPNPETPDPIAANGDDGHPPDPWTEINGLVAIASQTDGQYFVLITTANCPPCERLKQRIRDLPAVERLANCDSTHPRSASMMEGRQSYPQLIRFEVIGGTQRVKEFWNGTQNLTDFFRQ